MSKETETLYGELLRKSSAAKLVISKDLHKGQELFNIREWYIKGSTGEWTAGQGVVVDTTGIRTIKKAILAIDSNEQPPGKPTGKHDITGLYAIAKKRPGNRVVVHRTLGIGWRGPDWIQFILQFQPEDKPGQWFFVGNKSTYIEFERLGELQEIFKRIDLPGPKEEETE